MENRQDCESCRRAYRPSRWDDPADKERKKNGTPCRTCRPQVLRENGQAIEIYLNCSDQIEYAGFEGVPVAPNIPAIESILRIKRIKLSEREDCLDRVLIIFREVIRRSNAVRERRSSNKGKNQ